MPQTDYGPVTTTSAFAGLKRGYGHYDSTCTPTGGQPQIDTVTIDSAADDVDYNAIITLPNGQTATATVDSGTGATVTSIATALLAAIQAQGLFGANAVSTSAAGVITLTGRTNTNSYTISDTTANTTSANTQVAATGTSIPYGVGVMRTGETRKGYPACQLPSATSVAAQVMAMIPIANDTILYEVTIQFNDEKRAPYGPFGFTSDGTATIAEIVTGLTAVINTGMPANTVLAEDDVTQLTLTSEIPGIGFTAGVLTTTNWTSLINTTADGGKDFGGVATTNYYAAVEEGTQAVYTTGRGLELVETEQIYVMLDAGVSVAVTDPVYCRRVATGTEQPGAFRGAADGTDCFLVRGGSWRSASQAGKNSNNIALVSLERIAAL